MDAIGVDDKVKSAIAFDSEVCSAVAEEDGAAFGGRRIVLEFAEEMAMGGHVGCGSTVNDDGNEMVGSGGIVGANASRVTGGKDGRARNR